MRSKIVSLKTIKPLLAVVLCVVCHWAYAQATLPMEGGKVLFYDVVPVDSLSKDILHQNARRCLTEHAFAEVADSVTTEGYTLTSTGKFPVYATGYASKKQNGVITYTLHIDIKEKKYRYRFTDFVFHYYRENRNYQFVPTGKTKPLEDSTASGWQKTWESNKKTTQTSVSTLVRDLKECMEQHLSSEKTVKTPAKEW